MKTIYIIFNFPSFKIKYILFNFEKANEILDKNKTIHLKVIIVIDILNGEKFTIQSISFGKGMKTGFVTLLFLAFSQVTNLYSFLTHIFHHSIDTLYLSLALTKHPSISDLGRPEATLHDGSIGNGNPYGRFCPFNIRLSLCPHIPSQVGRSYHHLIPSYMNVLYSIRIIAC
jgi:hypothetical protein